MRNSSKFYHNQVFWYRVIFGISFLGLLVAGYLWYLYQQPQSIGCNITGGCETVRVSSFSTFLGVKVPVWGMLYYLGLCTYAIIKLSLPKLFKYQTHLFLAYVCSGILFTLYLTYLEVFVIHALCQWCVISAFCVFGVGIATLMSLWDWRR